ncbi:MAG: glycosyltransferase family 39 protein [Candidatus Aureabacteria bacterium]|nr:glycosyltransferase family 39 protein [Candidatus Auribacterota bacterium]
MKIRFDKYSLMLILFVLSLIIRFGYIYEMRADPSFRILGRGLDSFHYHRDAEKIATGNILLKGRSFQQAPGYSYFLAFIYKTLSKKLQVIRMIQAFLSSISILMIFLIALRLSKNLLSSFLSGIIWIFYAPSLFYDSLILKTSITIFCLLCFIYFLILFINDQKKGFLCGLFLGALIIIRPNFALLIFFIPLIYYFCSKKNIVLKKIFLLLFGILLLPSFLFVRNIILDQPFYRLSSVGARAVVQGQLPDAERLGWDDSIKGDKILESKSSLRTTLKEISKEPFLWFKLQIQKLKAFFSWYEYPNNYNFYLYKEKSRFLSIAFFSFIPVLIFSLYSIILLRNDFLYKKMYLLMLLSVFACIFPFYPFSRFRMILALMLVLPSGMIFFDLSKKIMSKKYISFVLWSLIIVLSFLYPHYLSKRFQLARHLDYFNFGNFHLECRDFKNSEKYYRLSIQSNPEFLPSQNNLGILYDSFGIYNHARYLWEDSLKKDPNQDFIKLLLKRLEAKEAREKVPKVR